MNLILKKNIVAVKNDKRTENSDIPAFIDVIKPAKKILFLPLILLAIFYAAVLVLVDSRSDILIFNANLGGPLLLAFLLFLTIYKTIRIHPFFLWSSYVLFLISCVVFFAVGPLVFVLGESHLVTAMNVGPLAINDYQLLRTNLLNVVGILSTFVGVFVFTKIRMLNRHDRVFPGYNLPIVRIPTLAMLFLVTGAALRYGLILPYQFGMTDFVLPGFLNSLDNLFDLGLALCAYLAIKHKSGWRIIFWLLLGVHLSTVMLEFAKTPIVIALVLSALGGYLAHRSVRRLIIWGVCAAVIFAFAQPFVHYGRNAIYADTKTIYKADFSTRLQIVTQWFSDLGTSPLIPDDNRYSAWQRLAYSQPQAFAMQEYDSGRPGDTLSNAWIVFIPRFIWPEKPVGISPAMDFYELVTGRRGTFLGLSVFGDGYWNFGWVGVVMFSGMMGFVIGLMSKWTLAWLALRHFLFLPPILLSVKLALDGTTKFFVSGILSVLLVYFVYTFAAVLILKPIRSENKLQ